MYDPFMRGFNCVPVCGYFTTIFEKRRAAFDKDVDLKKTAVTVNADTIIPGRQEGPWTQLLSDQPHNRKQQNQEVNQQQLYCISQNSA